MRMRRDFVVESKGHCFLCLDKIAIQVSKNGKPDHESALVIPTTCSLQSLSRYLGMELLKVFHQGAKDLIPQHLFKTIENSKLRGELCQQCGFLNDKFGLLCQNLEKIKMEVEASLNKIFLRLLKAKGTDKLDHLRSLQGTTSDWVNDWSHKLDILGILRTDATEKCSRIWSAASPRVKVQNMSYEEMEKAAKNLKCIRKSSPNRKNRASTYSTSTESAPVLETTIIFKMEYGSAKPTALDNCNDDTGSCSSNDSNFRSESMENDVAYTTSTTKVEEANDNDNEESKKTTFKSLITRIEGKPKTKVGANVSSIKFENGKYTCGACSKKFADKPICQRHYESVHLGVRFKCTICGKQFTDRGTCARHQKCAHVGVRYGCPICKKSFVQKGSLLLHQRTSDCGKKIASGNYPLPDANLHKPKHKVGAPAASVNPETGKHKCGTCLKEFSTKWLYQQHYKSRHLQNGFKCITCGNKFTLRSDCKRHQQTVHAGARFECQVCKKSFSQTGNLRFHQRKTDCGKKLGLKLHQKPCCHLCGKSFSQKSSLQKHLKNVHRAD